MNILKDAEFVVLDVETTGLSPRFGDRMVEVAALRIKGGVALDRFHSLLNPKRPISYGAYCVNRITSEMLVDAPTGEEILPEFKEFLGNACLVGHNIPFDLQFITHELSLLGESLDNYGSLDTVRMARQLLPEIGRYSLLSVARFFGIEDDQKHRAMEDVEMTFVVFKKLLEIADRRDVCDLDQLLALFGNKPSSVI